MTTKYTHTHTNNHGSGNVPVTWSELSAAIAANPLRSAGCGITDTGRVSASLTIAAVPASLAATTKTYSWLPDGWTEETTFVATDIFSFVLWIQDPLYRAATEGVRRTMEREMATALADTMEASWRTHNGKTRGWVRKHLEEDLRTRSAGGDAVADFWTTLRTSRRQAQMVDFVLVRRDMRMAVWWDTTVTMLPMSGVGKAGDVGICQIHAMTGRPLMSREGSWILQPSSSWAALVKEGQWLPPACVASAGAMTVSQIQERITAIVGAGGGVKRSGSRAALWAALHWEMLLQNLADSTVDVNLAILSDSSAGSTGSS